MLTEAIHLAVVGLGIVATMMFLLWLLHLPLRNAAIVDAGWAAGLAILALYYAAAGTGYSARRWAIASMAGFWGMRLALHLLTDRVIGKEEEGRYVQLRREWKTNLPVRFLLFFEFQALLDVFLSLPFLLACLDPRVPLGIPEKLGGALWIVGIVGEAIADQQLKAFKKIPENRGKVCRSGLWNYSRHPNYFFEWVIWVAYAVFAAASPFGWMGFLSPALILYFLLGLTGIPATEAQSLRSKGDLYRAYQRSTSAFVPWFPGKESS